MSKPPIELVEEFGGYTEAVDGLMAFSRSLWGALFQSPLPWHNTKPDPYYLPLDLHELINGPHFPSEALQADILQRLRRAGLSEELQGGREGVSRPAFQPLTFMRQMLPGVRPDHELRYFVMRNLRRHYSCELSPHLGNYFQILSDALNSIILESKPRRRLASDDSTVSKIDYQELIAELRLRLRKEIPSQERQAQVSDAFVECCRIVNYIQSHEKPGFVSARTENIDSAFLLSHLFGMTTGITGLDDLFGGGGLMLADTFTRPTEPRITGRAILAMGRYGSGKSLLSMQFAIDVARKGGLSYIMSVEQTPEEYLYGLTSICSLPPSELVTVATDTSAARAVLKRGSASQGAIIVVNPLRESFADFAEAFKRDMQLLKNFSLKLVVVDPVNAIVRDPSRNHEVRAETLGLFEEAKEAGCNIWLAAEEAHISGGDSLHEQNIADTVIRLSVDRLGGYTQRYFEITKSRFQREQRGKHAFSIVPGSGFRIYPSSAAVSAKLRPRGIRAPKNPVSFGLKSLDQILGDRAIAAGDVIVLQGTSGSFKTPLGLQFLLGVDQPKKGYAKGRKVQSLLVGARDNPATVRQMLADRLSQHSSSDNKSRTDIRICPISGGYVKPGYILQEIEGEFLKARIEGYSIDRVMVDNVAHWEMTCPFIQDEHTFGDTLVDLARRHQVTSLFICGDVTQSKVGILQQSIIDSADCLIQFSRVEFRGAYKVMLRVIKTRGMKHRRESFELLVGPRSVAVDTKSSLLRISKSGKVTPISVRLFLHYENSVQREYHEEWVGRLSSVLSPRIIIDPHDSGAFLKGMKWAKASAIDELQLCQIDEFQLPAVKDDTEGQPLHIFQRDEWNTEWDGLLPRLRERVQSKHGFFIAVPFFVNVSLLAYRKSKIDDFGSKVDLDVSSWESLARQCEEWEAVNNEKGQMFFDFAGTTDENYNCLFLEMLLSRSKPIVERGGVCQLSSWLVSKEANDVCLVYRRLCRRAHSLKNERRKDHVGQQVDRVIQLRKQAIVWRLWYSSANELMAEMSPAERSSIEVGALPGGISIAGEWYLAMPAYSAAHEVGLQIIKALTDRQGELVRLDAGVGLPTREEFYASGVDSTSELSAISPYFGIKRSLLRSLVKDAFVRSSFACYSEMSGILASHLKKIIEIPEASEELERRVQEILDSLAFQLRFLRPDLVCDRCRSGGIRARGQSPPTSL